jgi:hypothetical protein
MKASKFIDKMFCENSDLPNINNDGSNLSLIKKQMDEKFVDKEELKEKIENIMFQIESQVREEVDPMKLSSMGGYQSGLRIVLELIK